MNIYILWPKSSHDDGRPTTGALDLSCLPAERTLALKSSVLTDIKAQGLNLVSEFPQLQKIMNGYGFIVSCPTG